MKFYQESRGRDKASCGLWRMDFMKESTGRDLLLEFIVKEFELMQEMLLL